MDIDDTMSVMWLLVLIRDLQYNKSNKIDRSWQPSRRTSTSTRVLREEQRRTSITICLRPRWTRSTLTGENAGLHPSLFKKYFQPLKDRAVEETGKSLAEVTAAELETIKTETTAAAKEATQGEYLACLFPLLADDERYGPFKT